MSYNEKLIEKINSYKSYSKEEKERVLKQVPVKELTESQYKTVRERLPMVMKANQSFVRKFNKIHRAVYNLEVHRHAPELNRLHFKNGKTVKVSGSTTISGAIEQLINYNYDLIKEWI